MDNKVVSFQVLKAEILRRKYQRLLEKPDVFPSQKNWEYIIQEKMTGLGHLLYRKYLVALLTDQMDRIEYHDIAIKEFPNYLEAVGYDEGVNAIYSDLTSSPDASVTLADTFNLFNVDQVLNMIELGQVDLAIRFLGVFKQEYTFEDLEGMKLILKMLRSLPSVGSIEDSRSLFKSKQVYVCPQGHTNAIENEYCEHCGKNIQGLTMQQVNIINDFRNRIDVLEGLLKQQ
jgi:hypothetical protein